MKGDMTMDNNFQSYEDLLKEINDLIEKYKNRSDSKTIGTLANVEIQEENQPTQTPCCCFNFDSIEKEIPVQFLENTKIGLFQTTGDFCNCSGCNSSFTFTLDLQSTQIEFTSTNFTEHNIDCNTMSGEVIGIGTLTFGTPPQTVPPLPSPSINTIFSLVLLHSSTGCQIALNVTTTVGVHIISIDTTIDNCSISPCCSCQGNLKDTTETAVISQLGAGPQTGTATIDASVCLNCNPQSFLFYAFESGLYPSFTVTFHANEFHLPPICQMLIPGENSLTVSGVGTLVSNGALYTEISFTLRFIQVQGSICSYTLFINTVNGVIPIQPAVPAFSTTVVLPSCQSLFITPCV